MIIFEFFLGFAIVEAVVPWIDAMVVHGGGYQMCRHYHDQGGYG